MGACLTLALLAFYLVTLPPAMPSYRAIVREWHPSEAWLYDRDGKLIDSQRVDFQARRLDWVPLDKISPALTDAVIEAEDKRRSEEHTSELQSH